MIKTIKRLLYRIKTISKKESFPLIDKGGLLALIDGYPYIHHDEVTLFAEMARETKGTIVEIGAAFGASSAVFLLHSANGVRLHSIDPFIVDSMRPFQASEEKCKKNIQRILGIFKKSQKLKDWTVHKDYSFNVVKNWNEPIGLLFIDGDHVYDAVKKDFEDWLPHVRQGAYIMIHDSNKTPGTPEETFNAGWPGPTKLASELKNTPLVSHVKTVFSTTVWRKN